MEAARAVTVLRHGIHNVTVQEITDLADVGRGTFFNYFGTKDRVVPEFIRLVLEAFERALARAREGVVTAPQALNEFLQTRYSDPTIRDEMAVLGSVLREQSQNDKIREDIASLNRQFIGRLVELIEIGQKRKEFRRDYSAIELATFAHRSMTGNAIQNWQQQRRSEFTEALLELLISALTARPAR